MLYKSICQYALTEEDEEKGVIITLIQKSARERQEFCVGISAPGLSVAVCGLPAPCTLYITEGKI